MCFGQSCTHQTRTGHITTVISIQPRCVCSVSSTLSIEVLILDSQYGGSDNSTRPGGPLTFATFTSTNNTFRFMADNTTVVSIISAVTSNCSAQVLGNSSSIVPIQINATTNSSVLQPEQAVQYYRASSAVLFLDGYNNSNTFSNANDTQDTPLPAWVDLSFLDCLNSTISHNILLVNGARAFAQLSSSGALVLALLSLSVLSLLVF